MRASFSAIAVSLSVGYSALPPAVSDDGPLKARADSLYFAASPDESLALCREALASDSTNEGLHWRAARAEIAMGMLTRGVRRREHYDSALAHARRGLAVAPTDIDARYWVAAAAGRRARRDDPVYSIKLGYEVYNQATAILKVDSAYAGAHHAIGAVHAEVLKAPAFIRFIAGSVLRMDIAKRANWKDAERYMRRAVELDPQMVVYVVDLADLYGRAGMAPERDRMLARLNELELRHPMDRAYRDACNRRWQAVEPPR